MELCPCTVLKGSTAHPVETGGCEVRGREPPLLTSSRCNCGTRCVDELIRFFWLCHETGCGACELSWLLETWTDAALRLSLQEWDWQLWFSPSG